MADAVIIPSSLLDARRRERLAAASGLPAEDQTRLAQALAGLRAALEEQQRAVSAWRTAMMSLGEEMAVLRQTMDGYDDALAGLDTHVAAVRRQALSLQRIAGAAETLAP